MDQIIEFSGDPAGFDLGRLIGRRDAFAAISGTCSAAEALAFRRIRDEELYKALSLTWEECCTKLGVNRRQVDRMLALLKEFGPQYFQVAQFRHVTVEQYRALAPHVSDEGIHLDGEVIALLPENSELVSAAIDGLLEREKPVQQKAALSVQAMLKRCEALTEAIDKMAGQFAPVEAMRITTAISRLRRAAAEKGAKTL
jgi:hypothetical protein